MAAAKKVYNDIDEIFGLVLETDDSDIDLGDESDTDSGWGYNGNEHLEENEPNLPVEDHPGGYQADNNTVSPDNSEEEMEIDDDNELNNSIQEETEESVVDPVSENDEPLARIAQQRNNLPNNCGRQAAVRGMVIVVQDVESREELYVLEVAGEI